MPPAGPLFSSTQAAAEFARALPTRALGRALRYAARVTSTNDLASDAARGHAPHGSVFVADEQSKGRGRRGRTWEAPAGAALLFSVLVREPRLAAERYGWLALAAGLAASEALRETAGVAAVPKWPNDIVVRGTSTDQAPWRKLGGVLCESLLPAGGPAQPGYVVIGIGLNVTQDASELPPLPKAPATSVLLETGNLIPRSDLFAAVLVELERRLDDLCESDAFVRFRAELDARMEHAWSGLNLRISQAGRERSGRFAGLDDHGRLRLLGANGSVEYWSDAEILGLE
ncbi:MAG: biotin--[acetyl-CoA-carboxylase] ligase [Planctomycetota bacterium]